MSHFNLALTNLALIVPVLQNLHKAIVYRVMGEPGQEQKILMSTNGHHMSSLVISVILISSNYQFMKSMTTMQRILLGNKGGQQCKIIVQRKSITIKILSTGCAFPKNTL